MTRTTRATQVLSLLLVALTMGQLYAHVLELGPKMQYPPELYLRLNTSLYAWYGPPLGAAINTSAIIATGALVWMVRRWRSALLLTGTAFALQIAAMANYFARVEPVNVRFRALPPGQIPSDFLALRVQWEYGHALDFALYAVAFLLLVSALVHLAARSRDGEPSAAAPHSHQDRRQVQTARSGDKKRDGYQGGGSRLFTYERAARPGR